MQTFRSARRRGQGLSEYGLVLMLVSLVSLTLVTNTGVAASGLIGQVAGAVNAGAGPCDFPGCANGCLAAFEAAGGLDNPDAISSVGSCIDVCWNSFMSSNCNPESLQ